MKVALFVLLLTGLAAVTNAGQISPSLQARLNQGEILDVIIELPSLDDIFTSPAVLNAVQDEGTAVMIALLKERTSKSRRPFVTILSQLSLGDQRSISRPIWISNIFEVRNCDAALATTLARVQGDFVIREQETAQIINPVETVPVSISELRQNPHQWGVEMIEAPRAWNKSRGEGVVVGIIDTGVSGGHEALKESYGGAWYDPHYNHSEPNDANGHGTHCIGSVLGQTNGIGVAPLARWIACRGLNDEGSGSEVSLLSCAQWMLTADPKPNVVTNSWGGGSGIWFNSALQAWQQAGMISVFAIGNDGSSCRSTGSPGDSRFTIGVGATTNVDRVAIFSSRGPAGTLAEWKPEVSGPGENIISAGNNGNTYVSGSGTSMAAPHVSGVVALMLAVNPGMSFKDVKTVLQNSGDHPVVAPADIACSESGQPWPNYAFGYGRINAANAVDATLALKK